MNESDRDFDVEIFFDGACPLCTREVALLRRMDKRARIRFTDIAAEDFDPAPLGLDIAALMERIRGRLPDGTLIEGVEVFRRAYAAVGLGPIVALTRAPGVKQALDLGYHWFAKNRLKLTGRCDANGCAVPRAELHGH
jgi:predicted DCC family thiol-disulfide oxidoreductase YuxK